MRPTDFLHIVMLNLFQHPSFSSSMVPLACWILDFSIDGEETGEVGITWIDGHMSAAIL
jgi:hypothetical protein